MGDVLRRLFSRRIERKRMVGPIVLAEGRCAGAINRAGRRHHQVIYGIGPDGLEQVECAHDVRGDIAGWLLDAVPYAGLRGQMSDDFGLEFTQQAIQAHSILKHRAVIHKAWRRGQPRKPGAL